jgi:hypothetical protein
VGAEKFPFASDIPWDQVKEVRVSSDGTFYSFEFDLRGKKQKMTVGISPDQTSLTLSKNDGSPIVHATQKGSEISILDFSSKPTKLPGWVKKLQKKN